MRISGQATVDAARDRIWPLIFDPHSLLELLPGCEDIREIAPGEYEARLNLRVPAVSGAYQARVRVLDAAPPSSCRFEGEASGPAGTVAGQASFTLTEQGTTTLVDYTGDARISGPLSGMNPRFAEGIAKSFVNQGLTKLPALAAAGQPSELATRAPAGSHTGAFARLLASIHGWFARLLGRRAV